MTKVDLKDAQGVLKALLDKAGAGEDVFIVDGDRTFRVSPSQMPANDSSELVRPGRGSWKGHIHFAPDWDAPMDTESLGLGPDGDLK